MAYKKTEKYLRECTNHSYSNVEFSFVSDNAWIILPSLKMIDSARSGSWVRNVNPTSGRGMKEVNRGYVGVAAWGQGFSLYRLNDNGTTTEMVYDANPFNPSRNYQYMNGIAISDDKLNIFVTNYVYRHMAHYKFDSTKYDSYTKDVYNGGTSYDGGTTTFPNADFGRGHRDGTMVCGDWIYFSVDSSSDGYIKPIRWNWKTKVKEILDFNYDRDNYYRTNRYGEFTYHKKSDTLMCHGWYRTYYIFDASTDNPKPHVVRDRTGAGHWQGCGFLTKNKAWRAYGRGGIVIDDITTLRANKTDSNYSDASASLYVTNFEYGMQSAQNGHLERGLGRLFQGECQIEYDPRGDVFYAMPDRGTSRTIAVWDKYNFQWVYRSAHGRYAPHPKQARNSSNNYVLAFTDNGQKFHDYGPAPLKVKSYNNGTEYWMHCTYTSTNRIFNADVASVPYERMNKAHFEFRNFEHDDGSDVDYVKIRMLKNGVKLMPNTSVKVFVRSDSNNWQEYDYNRYGEYLLKLNTAGRYIDVRFEFDGDGIRFPYFHHYESPILELESEVSNDNRKKEDLKGTRTTRSRAKSKRRYRNRVKKIGR